MTPAGRPLSTPSEEYLSWLGVERGRAANTLAAYRRDLAAFEEFLEGRKVDVPAASQDHLTDYVKFLQAAGHSRASVARAMAVVRGLFHFLAAGGSLEADPTTGLELPGVPAGLPKALGEEEVTALIGAVTGGGPLALRDRAILEVLYGGGLRISELTGMSRSDITEEQSLLKVLGKGSKERLVPLGGCARAALAAWLSPEGRPKLEPDRWARRDDAEALFLNARGGRMSRQGVWLVVRKWGAEAGLDGKLTPHVLRHSCATHMLDHGADIRVVQELLGHASIATTQVYTRVSTARLRAVYDQAHPRSTTRSGREVQFPPAAGPLGGPLK